MSFEFLSDSKCLIRALDQFDDIRGTSFEIMRAHDCSSLKYPEMVLDYVSVSVEKTVRGLHFRIPWQYQVVTLLAGTVIDFVVDIDVSSEKFGKVYSVELSEKKGEARQITIPPGFAHGFKVISAEASVHYKMSQYYDPTCEFGIDITDINLGLAQILGDQVIRSDKDCELPKLNELPWCDA